MATLTSGVGAATRPALSMLAVLSLVAAGCGGGITGGTGGRAGAGGGAGGSGGSGDAGRADADRDSGAQETTGDAPIDENAPDTGGRDTYLVERGPEATGILIHVENGCPFELFIRGEGSGTVLQPDGLRLQTGESHDYLAPDIWPAARVTAHSATPVAPQNQIDKVEMTLEKKLDTGKLQSLGWRPRHAFEQGLAETVAWYKANERWWRPIKDQDPEFRKYYQAQYGNRT